jgi:integrase
MARPAVGQVVRRTTKRGITYGLRVSWRDPATGATERVPVHLGGEWEGWDEQRVEEERGHIARMIARGEWIPPERNRPALPRPKDMTSSADSFQVAASRHYDRRKRRMGSEKSRVDLHWRLAVAIEHLGEKPVDAVTAGDVDDMVDALLRERDAIEQAAAQGHPLVEDYVDPRTGRTHQRRRRGLSNSSINKVVRAVRAVLQDAVRHGVVERNVASDPETLVREAGPTRSFLEPFQVSALLDAGALLESEHRGLTWDDVHAIRASSASNVALARRYHVSDGLISKIRRRQVWATKAQRNRNDIPRVVLLATLVAAGLRISELCLLDGEDLDFAGRRIYVPRMRKDHGRLVRVQGIKTEAAERVIPMLPAVYDLLLEHKAEFDFGPHDPVFANRNGQRNAVDNVRRTIVETAVERANELLAARGQREIAHCTPHTLRRTFASILAEVNLPPRRAMYLLGHTDPTLTIRVYQQVIDMGEGGVQTLEQAIGCNIAEAFTLLSGRGVLAPNRHPSEKKASQPEAWSGLEGAETA